MTVGRRADRNDVIARSPDIHDRLEEILFALPVGVGTAYHGRQRLVVSTGGVFVLDPTVSAPGSIPGKAAQLAVVTREKLAERLRWVPFIDWFVVTEDEPSTSHIPADLVESTVLEGHCVDEATVRRIRALLEFGELTPPWHPGLPDRLVPDEFIRPMPATEIPII
jgi:hypothetical protein